MKPRAPQSTTHNDHKDLGDCLPRKPVLHITCAVMPVLVKSCRKCCQAYTNCLLAPSPTQAALGASGPTDVSESGVSVLTTSHPHLGEAPGLWVLKREGKDSGMKETLIASVFNKHFWLRLCTRSPWGERPGSCSAAVTMRNLTRKMTAAGSELNLSSRVELERRSVKTRNHRAWNKSLVFDIV